MKKDYSYCITSVCEHRSNCKRWLGNYQDAEIEEIEDLDYLNAHECIDCDFCYLDAINLSDGEFNGTVK